MPSWIDASKTGLKLSVLATVKILDAISDAHNRRNLNRPAVSNTPLARSEKPTDTLTLIKTLMR